MTQQRSEKAIEILANGYWNESYRLELAKYARADQEDRKAANVHADRSLLIERWGLIEWSEAKGRYTRTSLGVELSDIDEQAAPAPVDLWHHPEPFHSTVGPDPIRGPYQFKSGQSGVWIEDAGGMTICDLNPLLLDNPAAVDAMRRFVIGANMIPAIENAIKPIEEGGNQP